MPYNPQKHHRRTIRLQGFDYSQAGLYFITICVQDRKHLFGEIVNGEMNLNEAGAIADACWLDIPLHFPNAVLHEHIVMPNHLHGIIELLKDETVTYELPQHYAFQKMIPRSVSSIVKGFETGVTKWFCNNKVLVENELP